MMREAWRILSRGPVRLFRNNVGTGWQGRISRVTPANLSECRSGLHPGDLIIRGPRPLHAGLDVGSGDLLGWRSEEIRPEHVGQRWARFLSLEAKRPGGGRMERNQRTWRELVIRSGGIAGTFRSVKEAQKILNS